MKKLLLLIPCITILNLSFAQVQRCGTMDIYEQQIQQDSSYYHNLQQLEAETVQYLQQAKMQKGNVITIPVVFHIIHNGESIGTGTNISVAQIMSQLDVLNEDFRRLNADTSNTLSVFDSVAGDTQIEFCLATIGPNGPTNGIMRYDLGQSSWTTSDINSIVKPATIWNRDYYLNFWSANISGSILGYAQFPGGPSNTDGVVVGHEFIGRSPANPFSNNYNLGRTATHEIGHWLNLRHVWGDGGCSVDDGVNDTPLSDDSNFGCKLTHVSCGSLDMVQNYMDYSEDACMNIFTIGQGARMNAAINIDRPGLISSPGCKTLTPITVHGRVMDSLTGDGVGGVPVLLQNDFFEFETTTDTGGYFTFDTIYEDAYNVYAAKWGYGTSALNDTFSLNSDSILIKILPNVYYDDFVLDLGWMDSSTASTGHWVREVPNGTSYLGSPSNPGQDIPGDFGDKAYMTGNGGGGAGEDDVDNGIVTLYSPVFDLSSYADPYLSFYRWFFNSGGTGNPDDEFLVMISNGIATDTLLQVTANDPYLSQWKLEDFKVNSHIAPTANMQVIFQTFDLGNGHLVEAAVDGFSIRDSIVGALPPKAGFSSNITTVCAGESVEYSNQSTNGPNSLLWVFDGGTPGIATGNNPTVAYPNAGVYSVKLIVSNTGGEDSIIKQNYIQVLDNPQVAMDVNPVDCFGQNNGYAVALVNGGTPTYFYNWSSGDKTDSAANLSAGAYQVTVTDAFGCTGSASAIVTQPTQLQATTTSTYENAGWHNGSASVQVTGGAPGYTYLWNDAGQQTTATATGLTAATYTVTVTDDNGCTLQKTVTVERVVGINSQAAGTEIELLPNPANDQVMLHIELTREMGVGIIVLDMLGHVVWQQEAAAGKAHEVELSTENWPSGMYFIKMEIDGTAIVRKLVVSH